jgi:cytoskeletal protein CcmA (bactofilin family)
MASETPRTVIAEDIEITGSIKSAKNIQFDGKLNGDMVCNGAAIIGQGASIKGNVTVDSVTVLGQINGNLIAKDRIELKSAARVNGDIKAKRLTVEDGVTFIGKSEVSPGASQPISQAPAPTPEQKPVEAEKAPAAQPAKEDAKASGFFGRR